MDSLEQQPQAAPNYVAQPPSDDSTPLADLFQNKEEPTISILPDQALPNSSPEGGVQGDPYVKVVPDPAPAATPGALGAGAWGDASGQVATTATSADLGDIFADPDAKQQKTTSTPAVADTSGDLGDIFAEHPDTGSPTSGTMLNHGVARSKTDGVPNKYASELLPKDVKIAALMDGSNAKVDTLRDAVLDATYNMKKMAEKDGYKLLVTSGTDGKHASDSFHYHGEAVDVRILGKDGKDLPRDEESALAAKYGDAAGFGSMLDELHFTPSGRAKAVGENPHSHLTWGNELGTAPIATLQFRNRKPSDPDYYKNFTPGKATTVQRDQPLTRQAQLIATQVGVDPDVFGRLISQESAWNPQAHSGAGAFGLTQLMPDTALQLAKNDGHTLEEIRSDPKLQMLYGAKYLKQMIDDPASGGSYARALAAYNAGPGGRDKMLKTGSMYPESKAYVYNILKDLDSQNIKSPADAQGAFMAGTGYMHQADHIEHQREALVNDVVTPTNTLLSRIMGTDNVNEFMSNLNGVINNPNSTTLLGSLANPGSIYRKMGSWMGADTFMGRVLDGNALGGDSNSSILGQTTNRMITTGFQASAGMAEMANQFLHHLTFGIVPESKVMQDISKNTSGWEKAASYAAPNIGAMVPAMEMTLGWMAGKVARTMGILPESLGLAESAGTTTLGQQYMAKAAAGGYGAMSFPTLAAVGTLGAQGFVQSAVEHYMDYFHNPTPESDAMGQAEKVQHALGSGMMGALFNIGLGAVLPGAATLGESVLRGMTVGELATARTLANASPLRRMAAGALKGSATGGTIAAIGNMMGIDEAVSGHPVSGPDAILTGIGLGGGAGILAFGGLPFGTRALNAAAEAHPAIGSALDAARTAFSKLDSARSTAIGASLTELGAKYQRQAGDSSIKTVTADMAQRSQSWSDDLSQVHQALGQGIEQGSQQLQQAQQHLQQIQKKVQAAPTAIPDFQTRMQRYQDLENTLQTTQGQVETLRKQDPKDPQAQAAEVRLQTAQRDLFNFIKTDDGDGLNWNRKIADVYQSQKDLAQMGPQVQQQSMLLQKKQEKMAQLTDGIKMAQEAQTNHIEVLKKFQGINSDITQAPIFSRSNDELMDLWRQNLDTSHHSNTDFFKQLSGSFESGIQKITGAKGGVDSGLSKQASLAIAKRIDDGYAQEAINLLKATRDPNSVYGQTVLKNVKAINPWLSEITPQFDVNYHRMTAENSALNGKFSDVYRQMKVPRGGQWDQDAVNQWVNGEGRSQKLKYDYETAIPNMKVAQVRPSLVQDYVKQVADKYGVDSSSFTPEKVNATPYLDKLGDIQSKGLPVVDMESISARLNKAADPATVSELHSLYDQAVVAERAGDTHMPMGTSKFHQDNMRRDVYKANQKALEAGLKQKAAEWDKVAQGLSAEVVPGIKGSGPLARGAYTDLSYNPEYVLRSAYHTADAEAQLLSQFKVDPGIGVLKFDNKAVMANLQGELNRLAQFNDMIVGKENIKPVSPEVASSTGVQRDNMGPAKHYVLDSTRQNLVEAIGDAAHSDPKLNKTFDDFINPQTGAGFFTEDRNSLRSFENYMMAEVLNPEGALSIDKVRGWTSSNFQEHVFNRAKAGNLIANELHSNFGDLISRAVEKVNKDREVGNIKPVGAEDFMKDVRNVLEGADSLDALRDKYKGADGRSDHIDSVVGYSNRIKALTETMKAANPSIGDFMRPLYFHAMFPDAAAKMSAHGSGSNIGGLLSSENHRNFKTLKDLEGWVKATKQEIKDKMMLTGRLADGGAEDFGSQDFENLPFHERATVLENTSKELQDQLKVSDPEKYQKMVDRVNEKTLAYLYEKPLVDLPHVMTSEFRAALHADSWRRTMQFMKNSPVDISSDKLKPNLKNLLEIFPQSDKQTDIAFKGPKGEDLRYRAFSELPGMGNFRTELKTGEGSQMLRGDQMMLHPEAFNFLKENLNPNPKTLIGPLAKTPWAQALSRLHNISRNWNLLGTWIPHLSQALGSIQAGWMSAPLEAAAIVPLGRRILEDGSTTARQLQLHAIRSGVNSRGIDQSCRFLANEISTALGSDIVNKLYGVSDNRMGNRFLQSLDSHDPASKDAYNALSPGWKNASDFFGGGVEYNKLQLQNSLYSSIEAGMFGSFYHEIATMQKAMGGTLAGMDTGVATQVLEKTAAQLTNLRAGAMPYFMTPTAFRRELGEVALAPGWVTSKANMIIDAFDGALGLGQKGLASLVGKSVDPAELVSLGDLFKKAGFQKRYEGYSPEMKTYIRERMAQGVGSLLVAGAGMSIAFNMMKNGAPPWTTNPPEKMFHLKVGDTYWSNPLMIGSVRDILRFVGDSQQTDKDIIAKIGDSISGIVERNLSPDVAALEQWGRGKDEDGKPITVDARQGNLASIPGRVADYGSYVLRKAANWEGMTGTKDNPQLADLLRQNPDYLTKTQTPAEYLARSAGSYDSYYNISQHVSKDAKDRLDQYRFMAADRVEAIAKAARQAELEGDTASRQQFLKMIPEVVANGTSMRDTELQKAYANQGGKFHLSPQEVMDIVSRVMNPTQYAMRKETAKTASGALAGQKTFDQQQAQQQSQEWWKK